MKIYNWPEMVDDIGVKTVCFNVFSQQFEHVIKTCTSFLADRICIESSFFCYDIVNFFKSDYLHRIFLYTDQILSTL